MNSGPDKDGVIPCDLPLRSPAAKPSRCCMMISGPPKKHADKHCRKAPAITDQHRVAEHMAVQQLCVLNSPLAVP